MESLPASESLPLKVTGKWSPWVKQTAICARPQSKGLHELTQVTVDLSSSLALLKAGVFPAFLVQLSPTTFL